VQAGDPSDSERPETLTSRVFAAAEHNKVPLRTIVVTVAVVVVAGLMLALAWTIRTDLLLFGVAVFIAVLLAGPVAWLERLGMRRSLATSLVFFTGVIATCAIVFLFGAPLVSHVTGFVSRLETLVKQARTGQGWIGKLINRFHLHNWITQNAPKLDTLAEKLASPALRVGTAALTTVIELLVIAMLSFFLLLDLPKIWKGFLSLLPEDHARRVARVAHEASTGVTGYMLGNVLTSVIAGLIVFVSLLLFGVPYAGLLGAWVALVDLLPIIGTLVAGIPTLIVAALHSTTAFIGMLAIILVYQQIENHVLNPIVMSRTVKMSKLLILITVIVAATLGDRLDGVFGTFIGAIIGIPIGSAIQVIVRELRRPDVGAPSDAPEGP
jgi:predicted PurR-regulated permease PerM